MPVALAPGQTALLDPTTGEELLLTEDGGWYVGSLDLGHPTVREVVDDSPLADGTSDRTVHHGGRPVTLTLAAVDWDVLQARDVLSAWQHPRRRPVLRWRPLTGGARRMTLRPSSFDAVVDNPTVLRAVLGWVCPSGVMDDDEGATLLLRYLAGVFRLPLGKVGGATPWPLRFTGGISPSTTVTVPGTTPCWWSATITGQVIDPAVLVDGLTLLRIVGTVPTGTTLTVDGRARTVTDQTGAPWYDRVDWASSLWQPIPPGEHTITLGGTPAAGAACRLDFRGAWL